MTWANDIERGQIGTDLFAFAETLFPICRSITGNGLRETLQHVSNICDLELTEVPTGDKVLDWTIPNEWNITGAHLTAPDGSTVIDFKDSNLSVVNYSAPVDIHIDLDDLQGHLHSLPDLPDLIPYRTSYYKEDWGFCLPHAVRENLIPGKYHAVIDSSLSPGSLTYGEAVLPGRRHEEILISAHSCHPSLANDNLSGIAVATYVARMMRGIETEYTFRFIFAPGTIGAISWLARNRDVISRIKHVLILANLGDEGPITYKKSRDALSNLDRTVRCVLRNSGMPYGMVPFSPYGYDERQYSSPGFGLDAGCLSRSQWGTFPEYHTSADNLSFISPTALEESFRIVVQILESLDVDCRWQNLEPEGEPQLGKRGLYSEIGGAADPKSMQMKLLWLLNQSDGTSSILDIAEKSGYSLTDLDRAARILERNNLLSRINE